MDDLQCPICYDLGPSRIGAECGHLVCDECLEKMENNTCPMCMAHNKKWIRSTTINNHIQSLLHAPNKRSRSVFRRVQGTLNRFLAFLDQATDHGKWVFFLSMCIRLLLLGGWWWCVSSSMTLSVLSMNLWLMIAWLTIGIRCLDLPSWIASYTYAPFVSGSLWVLVTCVSLAQCVVLDLGDESFADASPPSRIKSFLCSFLLGGGILCFTAWTGPDGWANQAIMWFLFAMAPTILWFRFKSVIAWS